MKLLCGIALFALGLNAALAQTATTFAPGQSILATTINNAFANKADYANLTAEAATARANEAAISAAQVHIGITTGTVPDAAATIAGITAAQTAANSANTSLATLSGKLSTTVSIGSIPLIGSELGFPGLNLTAPFTLTNISTATQLYDALNVVRNNAMATSNTVTSAIQAQNTTGINESGQDSAIQALQNDYSQVAGFQSLGLNVENVAQPAATGREWGEVIVSGDRSGLSSLARSGSVQTAEFDLTTSYADNQVCASCWGGHGVRVGLQFVLAANANANPTSNEIGSAISFGGDAITTVDHVLAFANAGGVGFQTFAVVDARNTVAPPGDTNPVYALIMPGGDAVDFDGDCAVTQAINSAPCRTLSYSKTNTELDYFIGTTKAFFVSDNGQFNAPVALSAPIKFTAPFITPASSTAACTQGQQEADASYEYVCVATNTWKRAALSSF